MHISNIIVLGTSVATTAAVFQGFNYGSTNTDGSAIGEDQYRSEFATAQQLVGTSGFSSARLYTMIQGGTSNTPTEAIPAAINTTTSLLLGIWASAGEANIDNEIATFQTAISTYGTAFTDLIVGVSVGSEDLYRISPTGIENLSGVGASPDDIVSYIGKVKNAIASTSAKGILVGHVDTWTAWVNGSNDAVIGASDFIGMDAYPYFQNTMANSIDNAYSLFFDAYDQTLSAAGNKPVWVTETGWPVSGSEENQAQPNTQNAKTYWDQVGCNRLFGKINTWWYTLQDDVPTTPSPSFGIVGNPLSTNPLYDLSCSGGSSASSSSVASATSSDIASSAQAGGKAGAQGEASAIESGKATVQTASTSAGPTSAEVASSSAPAGTGSAPAGSTVEVVKDTTVYTTLTTCPATTISGGETKTYMTTSTVVITSCSGGCPESVSAPASSPAASTLVTSASVLPSITSVAPGSSPSVCSTGLNGQYEFPHLIIPVSNTQPSTAFGTSYNGIIDASTSSIFNFDIPSSDVGKTCTLVFLFPEQSQLSTSAFSFSGSGGLNVSLLESPATEQTTYDTVSSVKDTFVNGPGDIQPGNEYVIASGNCPAGERVGYEVSATGSLALKYFQDSNPSPIGLYIVIC
ncbi:hypothetical protein MMC09_004178 [Bachmanniomyces sp. S44760]|nr:hypothetical protein [Bachmanniomyces sp. S44760]